MDVQHQRSGAPKQRRSRLDRAILTLRIGGAVLIAIGAVVIAVGLR